MNVEHLAVLALLFLPVACAAAPVDAGKKPEEEVRKAGRFILKNPRLLVEVMKPGDPEAAYVGTRFEWGAMILQVTLDGKNRFMAAEKPGRRDGGIGPSEEMNGAIGYQAEGGRGFLKIGVGICESNQAPYNPNLLYKMLDDLRWKISVDDKKRKATFVQVLKDFQGWGYRYEKRVVLDPKLPRVQIEHVLENIGTKPINVSQYSHNFMLFDGHKVGPDYVTTFTFAPGLIQNEFVGALDKSIIFKKPLEGGYYSVIKGYQPKPKGGNPFVVRHKPSGLAVRFERDFPMSGLTLWARPTTVSFEPFITLNVKPGSKTAWTRSYTFMTKGED